MGDLIASAEFNRGKFILLETVKNDKSKICSFESKLFSAAINESKTYICCDSRNSVYTIEAHKQLYKVEVFTDFARCSCSYIKQMNFPCTLIFFVCKKNIVDYYQYISDYNSLYKYYFTYFAEYT